MAFHVRDKETDTVVREVARLRGEGLTETIRAVFGEELKRRKAEVPLQERIRRIQEKVLSYPPTGLEADKAFYDSLNDEED